MSIPFSVYDFFGYLASGFLILVAVDYSTNDGKPMADTLAVIPAAFWLTVAYIIGHIVANIASFLLEHKFLRECLRSPEETLFEPQSKSFWAKVFPIFYRPFPVETQERVMTKARKLGIEKPGRGLFFHCHAIAKRDKTTLDRLSSFLNQYGFCRNISMTLLLVIPMLLYGGFRHVRTQGRAGLRAECLLWAGMAAIASIGMFYRYLKFFRHYTMEVFQTYAELPSDTPSAKE